MQKAIRLSVLENGGPVDIIEVQGNNLLTEKGYVSGAAKYLIETMHKHLNINAKREFEVHVVDYTPKVGDKVRVVGSDAPWKGYEGVVVKIDEPYINGTYFDNEYPVHVEFEKHKVFEEDHVTLYEFEELEVIKY